MTQQGIGTRIRLAIEATAAFRITCKQCKVYCRRLNRSEPPHDADAIVEAILPGVGLPATIREEVGGTKEQRVWLRAIVERVINEQ